MDDLTEAIREAFGVPLVTKWVLVAEVIDPDDGDRYLGRLESEDLAMWEQLGMLDFHTAYLRRSIETASEADEDTD